MKLLVGSGSELVEQVASWRWEATDALVAVGTDVVVAWQCSQCLVEQASEQMAVGVHAVPPSVAATSLRQVVLPHSTAQYWATGEVLLSHGCTRLYTTSLSPHVGDDTSNSHVQTLSLSSPIHPSLSVAAQQMTVLKVHSVVHCCVLGG